MSRRASTRDAGGVFRALMLAVVLAACGGSTLEQVQRSPDAPAPVERPSPALEAGPPPPSDWTTEYRGAGSLTVTVRNASETAVFVRIRDDQSQTTAAQVSVPPSAETSLYLGGGNFDVLMRASIGGSNRYFKGDPIAVPAGMVGNAVLSVGIGGAGDALHEIDAAEFER